MMGLPFFYLALPEESERTIDSFFLALSAIRPIGQAYDDV